MLGVVQAVRQKATRKGESMAFITLEDPYGSMELLVFPNVYTRYHSLFREGAVVLAEGRVSLTEEKDTKLVCDAAYPPPAPQAAQNGLPAVPPAAPAKEKKHASRPGLYLRVEGKDSPLYQKALQYIAIFDGPVQLYVYFTDTGKLVRAPASLRVDVNPVLLRELRRLLGEDGVAVVE